MDIAEYPIVTAPCGLPFVLCGIGKSDRQQSVVHNDGSSFYQILYAKNGVGRLIYNGFEYEIKAGDAVVLMPDVPYEYCEIEPPWEICWIIFVGESMDKTLGRMGLDSFAIIHFNNIFVIDEIFRRLLEKAETKDALTVFNAAPALFALITELFRQKQIDSKLTQKSDLTLIVPALKYIEKHYKEQITLDEIAETLGITPEHFCTVFKSKMQVRPFEYIALMRIQEAKRLLTTTDMSIAEIGKAVGYADKSYFGSVFKRYERVSPSVFRGNF